jgi:DNA-binding NtrC family response regulator
MRSLVFCKITATWRLRHRSRHHDGAIGIPFAKELSPKGSFIVSPPVVLFQFSKGDAQELTQAFVTMGVNGLQCHSLSELDIICHKNRRAVILLDLDNATMSNRVLKDLRKKHPFIQMIGISNRSFHPELKESMQLYLYACVSKPVDVEEVMYLIQSIFRDLAPHESNWI